MDTADDQTLRPGTLATEDVPREVAATRLAPSALLRTVAGQVLRDDVLGLAAEIAYRFLFAVFPFGLFVAALGAVVAGWLDVQDPAAALVAGLGDNLPPALGESLQPELETLLTTAHPGLLTVAALGALVAATGGTAAIVKGIHRAYGVQELRPFLLRAVVAVALTLGAAAAFIAAFVTIVGGATVSDAIAARLGAENGAAVAVGLARWPLVFGLMTLTVGLLYRYAPSIVVPWRWILAGAATFTLGWMVATAALGWYIGNVSDYGATYGSLGAVIVLMLWFYLGAILLLVGAEVTAVLAGDRSPDEIRPRGEESTAVSTVGRIQERTREAVSAVTENAGP